MKDFRINLVILSAMLTSIAWGARDYASHVYLCNGALTVPLELIGLAGACAGGIVYCAKRLSGWNGND